MIITALSSTTLRLITRTCFVCFWMLFVLFLFFKLVFLLMAFLFCYLYPINGSSFLYRSFVIFYNFALFFLPHYYCLSFVSSIFLCLPFFTYFLCLLFLAHCFSLRPFSLLAFFGFVLFVCLFLLLMNERQLFSLFPLLFLSQTCFH